MLTKKRGFADCVPYCGVFICDLLGVLPLYGVTELHVGRHADRWQSRLQDALTVMRVNAWKRHDQIKEKDKKKAYGLMHITFALARSNAGGLDVFWSFVNAERIGGSVCWRGDEGMYALKTSPGLARQMLENEFEPDYARFVKSCAKLIAKKLKGY